MKLSEMIALLQAELASGGDREVELHGTYGAVADAFEVMDVSKTPKTAFGRDSYGRKQRAEYMSKLHIWTGIHTG